LKKQPPRYFCDNCGQEVGYNTRACPFCGRLFVSVRCPNCGYSGPEKRFQNGCPLCGYSDPNAGKVYNVKEKKQKQKTRRDFEPLPSWAYIAMAIALLVLVYLCAHIITM
jgi:uncharacterized membrane protein YvbJ